MHDFAAKAEVLQPAMLSATQSPSDFVPKNPPAILHKRGTKP